MTLRLILRGKVLCFNNNKETCEIFRYKNNNFENDFTNYKFKRNLQRDLIC